MVYLPAGSHPSKY